MKNNVFPDDYDEKPWAYDFSENLDGIIKSHTRLKIRLFWFAAIVVNSFFTLPIVIHLYHKIIDSPNINNATSESDISIAVYIFFGFIISIGLAMLYTAYLNTKEWLHYGEITLETNPFPGSIGGTLTGEISLLKGFQNKRFKLTLTCIEHYKQQLTGSSHVNGHSNITREKELWKNELYATKELFNNKVNLVFSFDIPKNLPESGRPSYLYNYWQLNITSEGGNNIILDRNFIVPVYRT